MASTTEVKAVSASGWKKAATHNICLPSGVRVDIKVPNITQLIESGALPQNLLDAALSFAKGEAQEVSVETLRADREFEDFIVKATVVNPSLTDADLLEIPYEDKDFLVQIATRRRDLDAEGEHIGGLMSSEKFRRFRGFREFDPDVEGL